MPDFLTIAGMPCQELLRLLSATQKNVSIAEGRSPNRTTLNGQVIANLFFEDSTRTRCSFETAVHRLGGQVFNLTPSGSSISKGESLVDTARNIECMGVAAIVVRCAVSGGAKMVADGVKCPVINAGDGRHEHPTQAILDVSTLMEEFGSVEGRTVAIVGDIINSRVARSVTHALSTLGAHVRLVGPPTLVSKSFERITQGPGMVLTMSNLDSALDGVDAVMMLRVQFERAAGGAVSSDYRQMFGLTPQRIAKLAPHVVILHPGPMNRGIEIDDRVADDPLRSRILRQVTHGVAARMAVLEMALGANVIAATHNRIEA
ncbi:MAG: aspartate carbamoyltransferase catalytic subunit [Planctomycetota bacterium]|nr:aspartate carbamoyltransferase catalytic subunit [Planctomycetota bacterium]MDA1261352.1 aspartate carbamoyltransferase catalytic subunit [Planctomycetota bacterium]